MIFKPLLIHKIAEGKKTQARVPVKDGEDEAKWKVGRAYAAVPPGRGKSASLHFIVSAVRVERLGDLSFEDARAEGFKTRDEFYAEWSELYGDVDLERRVWVIAFRRDDRDMPRLLAARMGRGDYTADPHQAVRDEPEAISDEQHARLFEHAQAKDHNQRRAPLASSMENLRREIDELRNRMVDSGLSDARLRKAIDQVEYHAEIVAKRLAA